MNQDSSQLRILSIFHYVVAGIAALFSCFPIFYLILGMAIFTGSGAFSSPSPADFPFPFQFFGALFIIIPAVIFSLILAYVICMILAGYYLEKKQHYLFCMVMAAISCTFTPFGTVLGIFTIIVLSRQSVKELFQANAVIKPTP